MNIRLLQFIFFLLLFLIVQLVPITRDCIPIRKLIGTKLRLAFFIIILNSTFLILNCYSQWIQQNLPVPAAAFMDMKFANINTGFIAQYNYSTGASTFLKTTNEGYNWQVISDYALGSMNILDSIHLYALGYNNLYSKLYKSTNCGISWDSLLSAYSTAYYDIHFFNYDTGLISGTDSYYSYIWRTTNEGISKDLLWSVFAPWPCKFFFLKEKINGEYYGWMYRPGDNFWYLTTNSGSNWTSMPNLPDFPINNIFFINKDTGWATVSNVRNYILYTTNGGYNWINQNIQYSAVTYGIYFVNPNKGWIGFDVSHKILCTTNGGLNWGTQYIPNGISGMLFFLDSVTGWAQTSGNTLAHTTNGGGNINSISLNSQNLPDKYILFQNYPNPFNQFTIINYQCTIKSNILLKVYDISGNEIITIVNEKKNQGAYEIRFDGSNLASGVYFYRLVSDKFVQVKKMVLIK